MQVLGIKVSRFIRSWSACHVTGVAFVFLFLKSTLCWSAFYQINSETVRLPKATGLQADLKLLVGLENSEPSFLSSVFKKNRASLGAYSLYQSDQDPSFFLRYGPVVQLRSEFLLENLYLQYEHHEYQYQSSFSSQNLNQSENRYGLFYSRYDNLFATYDLDTYGETFFIPEVSTKNLLSVIRLTFLEKKYASYFINPFAEVYLKDSPQLFGGKRQEIRLGLQYMPIDAISIKVMGNLLPASDTSSAGLLYQINIFKEGSL